MNEKTRQWVIKSLDGKTEDLAECRDKSDKVDVLYRAFLSLATVLNDHEIAEAIWRFIDKFNEACHDRH